MDILTADKAAEIYLSLGFLTLVDYQKAYNLVANGLIDSATERSLLRIRYCQLPEFVTLDATQLRKWGKKQITYKVAADNSLPGFTRDDLYSVFQWAFGEWAKVCDLVFSATTGAANITITTGRIDSAGNTLAWSELPAPNAINQQLQQKFDSGEPFVFSANPPPSKIDLGAVACHEIGHALGLDHLPSGSRNLLAPIYSPSIRVPQGGDIAEVQRRYGKPSVQPAPTPTPEPTPEPGEPPQNTVIPLPFDPAKPGQTIFPPGLALPKLVGYTWIAVPSGHIPPTRG